MSKGILTVPVVDIFAGPGGLGEGFSAYESEKLRFKIVLSVEKDEAAHQTLELRAFYRQFHPEKVPTDYYDYLAGKIEREKLFEQYPKHAKKARKEAWHAELGGKEHGKKQIDERIRGTLSAFGDQHWVLIGGPPCQAYSLIGRARMRNVDPDKFDTDPRHFLYRHYLRILAQHSPAVFIMENVKGMLSSRINGELIFDRILNDLKDPLNALKKNKKRPSATPSQRRYSIYSLVTPQRCPHTLKPREYIIKAERYGIPQTRHRVILLGVRQDIDPHGIELLSEKESVSTTSVISDLPALRSRLSREPDSAENWRRAVENGLREKIFSDVETEVYNVIEKSTNELRSEPIRGGCIHPNGSMPEDLGQWFYDSQLIEVCNHEARAHMRSDLHRYLFASSYARVHGDTPKLRHYPEALLPNHQNVELARNSTSNFCDRFRVQVAEQPSSTITSHISKDGHYYIHYDPTQCRSLTVREAARLQTFPDNYFFEGTRTQQYVQVGNAVPPLLAFEIATIVADILCNC